MDITVSGCRSSRFPRREIDVGDDDRHRAGALDRHEGGAREQRPSRQSEQIAVEPRDRVDTGEQAARQAVAHALDAEHQPGHRVVSDGRSPDQRTRSGDRELHAAASGDVDDCSARTVDQPSHLPGWPLFRFDTGATRPIRRSERI
jgi:hypothetical protein